MAANLIGAEINRLSLEYIYVEVAGEIDGAPANPTISPVQMAFTQGPAEPSAWSNASWETDSTPSPRYLARCLVGPGGDATLSVGTYSVFVKFSLGLEEPVLQAPTKLKVV